MAEMWKPLDNKTYKEWVEAILEEASDDLSDWETNFISNMQDRLLSGYTLSKNQAECLEKIYAQKTK